MPFTFIGKVLAYLMVLLGICNLAMGISAAISPEAALSRYLVQSSGDTIDTALAVIVTGVIVGILTEISRSVRSR